MKTPLQYAKETLGLVHILPSPSVDSLEAAGKPYGILDMLKPPPFDLLARHPRRLQSFPQTTCHRRRLTRLQPRLRHLYWRISSRILLLLSIDSRIACGPLLTLYFSLIALWFSHQ